MLCWRSREEIPYAEGKRNPSKMVGVAGGHQRADTLKPYSQKTSQSNHTRTTALSNSVKLSHACGATQDGRVMVERSDRMWSAGEGNGKPLQYSCNIYHFTWVSLTLGVGYLFTAGPAKCSCCSLPSMRGISTPLPFLTFQVLCNIALYSIGPCFYHQSHPQLGIVFVLAPSLHSFWNYFSTDLQQHIGHLPTQGVPLSVS